MTMNSGVPQDCVLSPLALLYLHHECVAMHSSNAIRKLAKHTNVVGQIMGGDESAYRSDIEYLEWCCNNSLLLNVIKTKELPKGEVGRPYTSFHWWVDGKGS